MLFVPVVLQRSTAGLAMNVSLTEELEGYIRAKIATGMYHSASEVIREGLRLLQERDALQQAKLERLRQDILIGIEQIERGEYDQLDHNALSAYAQQIKISGHHRKAEAD
jgi:antitoxin ParD1/3/4